jgi:preprotein translocase subunit SecG
MTILFTILHVIVCLFLILVVLAQQGKGQDLASAFGGAGSQTAFGARGTATLLSKITAGAAILFMVTSLMLSYLRPVTGQRTVVPETAPASAPAPATQTEGGSTPTTPPAEESTTPSAQPESEAPAPEGTEAAPATTPAPEKQPQSTTSAPSQQEPKK